VVKAKIPSIYLIVKISVAMPNKKNPGHADLGTFLFLEPNKTLLFLFGSRLFETL